MEFLEGTTLKHRIAGRSREMDVLLPLAIEIVDALDRAAVISPSTVSRTRTRSLAAFVLVVVAAVSIGLYRSRSRGGSSSNSRPLRIVAEFTNSTGDPVVDETLQYIATTELERAAAFEVVDFVRVAKILKSIGQTPPSFSLTSYCGTSPQ